MHAEDAEDHDTLLCVSAGANKDTPGRFKFDGSGYYRNCPKRCGRCSATCRRPATTPSPSRSAAPSSSRRATAPTCRSSRCPTARPRRPARQRGAPGPGALPHGVPDYAIQQAEFEERVIIGKGYPGYFLVVADYIRWAKENGIRVGPGMLWAPARCARSRCGSRSLPRAARPDLRALPQPGASLMPGLRRGLRRTPPGRGDPRRVRQVRRRPGLPDRHVRHDQGEAGDQGRLGRVLGKPFALGEQITRSVHAGRPGRNTRRLRTFDPEHDRYGEGTEFRECKRRTSTSSRSSTPRAASRG